MITGTSGAWEGYAPAPGRTHSEPSEQGMGQAGTLPMLHTDPFTQGRNLTRTRGLNRTSDWIISYFNPGATPRKPGVKIKFVSSLALSKTVCMSKAAPSQNGSEREPRIF